MKENERMLGKQKDKNGRKFKQKQEEVKREGEVEK